MIFSFIYQAITTKEETTADIARVKEAIKTRCAEEQVDCPEALSM